MKNHFVFKNLQLVDLSSPVNGQTLDIEVRDGKISDIGTSIESKDAEIIEASNHCISPGLFDMQVTNGEPGAEEKETFHTLNNSALRGGITGALVMPSSKPATDTRGQIEFIQNLSRKEAVKFHPCGSISVGLQGTQMAEMAEMKQAGAIAFSDDKHSLSNTVLVHLAMQYNKISGGLLCFHAEDSAMSLGGKVNEGLVNVQLGMKGSPSIAEELGVVRLLTLAEYHGIRIHIQGISSQKALEKVRLAKKSGVKVSCSTYAHHLFFNDEVLHDFDSNYKVWPPIRSEKDRQALIAGVIDGTIDVISSDHRPETTEHKDVEFDYAEYGIIGLETLFSAAFSAIPEIKTDQLIDRLGNSARRLLGLPELSISKGADASFFIYKPQQDWVYQKENIQSKSANSPFVGKTLKGKIVGTYTANSWYSF